MALPFTLTFIIAPVAREPENPCIPSPCGPNSQCRVIGSQAACSCLPNYVGQSPNCRPECTISAECPSNLACINEKCKDPCPGSCGTNARCSVVNHNAICTCVIGYEGDPTIQCNLIPTCKKRLTFKIIESYENILIIFNSNFSHTDCNAMQPFTLWGKR